MKKILMIATCNFLLNPNDGGRQCSYRNYSVLCQVFGEKNVRVCMISNEDMGELDNISVFPTYKNKIQQVKWALENRVGYSLQTEKQIIKIINGGDYDYLWLDRSTLGRLYKNIMSNAKKIVFFHNIEIEYIKNKIRHEGIGFVLSYFAFLYNEREAVQKADKIICLNIRDSELLNKTYGRKADFLLPISFKDKFEEKNMPAFELQTNITKTLLFIGSFFRPNIEGINWFIKNVMVQLPDVKLLIVGKGLEKKASEWECGNVKVIGTVQDVSKYYMKADAVVLPIFYGDGMKVKTAEALMYGKVIFGTSEALEGYETEGQSDIYECETAEDFVESIKGFYKLKRKGNISISNRKLFLDKYENKAIATQVEKFFQSGK